MKNEKSEAGAEFIILQSEEKDSAGQFNSYAVGLFEKIQGILKGKPKGKVLFQVVSELSGLSGLLKTAHLENPKFIGQLIEIDESVEISKVIEENRRCPDDVHVRYKDGKRLIADLKEIEDLPQNSGIVWKDKGVYLITGGAGGLGLIFAKEICRQVKDAVLILTGRSELIEEKKKVIEELNNSAARVEYKQADVTQRGEAADLIKSIKNEFGELNGIIHSAGIIRDNFIIKKTREEFEEVLGPKVSGVVNLDIAVGDYPLDFFILFSSGAGAFGNAGQADYSTGNAFMDAYAQYRSDSVRKERCKGKTLSIGWPLWEDGGMQVNETTKRIMLQNSGMR
ncbi:MAG: SDR family NAD(P)-dependent oxidoreductase, partial [Proteobacteria bacterium]|nr:SDR family NAD(P)-dependent oxidoreductase [Pseudomonadota bacterium]